MISKVELLPLKEKRTKSRNIGALRGIRQILGEINLKIFPTSVLAFFISRVTIMDGLTPFGMAFLVAYLGNYGGSIMIPIASTLGLISIQGIEGSSYIGAVWLIYAIRVFFARDFQKSTISLSTYGFLAFVIIRLGFTLVGEYFLYDVVMIGFEGIIVFTLTYIFSYSISTVKGRNKILSNEEVICGAIMISLAISGIGNISVYEYSVQNVIGVFLVILLSYSKGPAMGTVVGVTIGVICGMSTPDMPMVISIFAFSGLLSGLFKDLGKIGTSIGFMLGNGIISFYMDGYSEMTIKFQEVLVATALLIILSKVIKGFEDRLAVGIVKNTEFKDAYSDRLKDITYKRLREISQVFEELGTTFNRVSHKERIIEQKDISRFVDTVVEDVCENCSLRRVCWENDFYTTYYAMFNVMNSIELKGAITKDSFPKALKKRCIKPDALANKSNYLFDIYKLNYQWENKILESRQLVSQQLEGVSKIIRDLANEMDKKLDFKEDVEKRIFSRLKNSNIDIKEVIVTESTNEHFEIHVEAISDKNKEKCTEKITSIISEIVGFKLVENKFTTSTSKDKKRIKLKLLRANRFGALTKVSKSVESFNYVSGDNYTFGEKSNNYFVALSDGMGMGQKANLESDITISLLEKFLEAGFDKELALRTINSILVLKSTDEIFATIDMSIMDLYTGKNQFIKIGSAPTFIKRRNNVKIINSQSLPVGILKDIDFQIFEEEVQDGDLIIMMSDGVLDANCEEEDKENWMANLISSIDSVNPQTMADKIISSANQMISNNKKDDMTVLVTKVWKKR